MPFRNTLEVKSSDKNHRAVTANLTEGPPPPSRNISNLLKDRRLNLGINCTGQLRIAVMFLIVT